MSCPLGNETTGAIECEYYLSGVHCPWFNSTPLKKDKGTHTTKRREGEQGKSKNQSSYDYRARLKESASNGDIEAIAKLEKIKESNRIARLKYKRKNKHENTSY